MANGWGQAAAAAAMTIGSLLAAKKNNKSSAQEINQGYMADQFGYESNLQWQQHQWLEKMSNTAHQREMADLKAAGLNPLLTATGGQGATTPQGGMGAVGLPDAGATVTERQNKIANALQLRQLDIAQQNANSTQNLQESQADLNDEQSQTEKTKQALNLADRLSKLKIAENMGLENSVFEQRFNIWKQHMVSEILGNISSSAKMQNEINMSKQYYKLEAIKTGLLSSANEKDIELKNAEIKKIETEENRIRNPILNHSTDIKLPFNLGGISLSDQKIKKERIKKVYTTKNKYGKGTHQEVGWY